MKILSFHKAKNFRLFFLFFIIQSILAGNVLFAQGNAPDDWKTKILGTWQMDSFMVSRGREKSADRSDKEHFLISIREDNTFTISDLDFFFKDSCDFVDVNHKKIILADFLHARVIALDDQKLQVQIKTYIYSGSSGILYLHRVQSRVQIPSLSGEWDDFHDDTARFQKNRPKLILGDAGALKMETPGFSGKGTWSVDSVNQRLILNVGYKQYQCDIYNVEKSVLSIADPLDKDERLNFDRHISSSSPGTLIGAGSTFAYPLYSQMFNAYKQKTGTEVNYMSIGSGGGIKQLGAKTVNFAASDAFLKEQELLNLHDSVVEVPTCLGAVAVVYNLPGITNLNLDSITLGGIYSGKITMWNDPKIEAINKGIQLPAKPILVLHRADGSGTTYIFTSYLCQVSPEFNSMVPKAGKEVNWPVGVGGKGNEGIAGQIKGTEGTIGYVEYAYSVQNNLPVANLKNQAGKFIKPDLASISASGSKNIPPDTRVLLVNSNAADAYPITSFSWLVLYKEQNYNDRSYKTAKEMADLAWWMIHDGQEFNEPLLYGRLSPEAVKVAEKVLKTLTYNGAPLL